MSLIGIWLLHLSNSGRVEGAKGGGVDLSQYPGATDHTVRKVRTALSSMSLWRPLSTTSPRCMTQ
jgi:hypothetical protein